MNYQREWKSRRNAAGFAAECARLALVFCEEDHRSDLVAAIELAERCAAGEEIDDDVRAAARAAYIATAAYSANGTARGAASAASASAAYIVAYVAVYTVGVDAAYAAVYADHAGVDDHEIQAAFARWVVRDLSCGRELPVLLRQAAGAAVVAGDEELAKEILNRSEPRSVSET